MAMWITKPEKQREIQEYFASINSMSLRIIEDIQKVQNDYQTSWRNFTPEERDEKINEEMVSLEVMKRYPLPKSKGLDVFPCVKIDTGQKVVELHSMTSKNEVTTSWRDEHSGPFSLHSKSQMDLRLPPSDSKKRKKRKKSSEKVKKVQNVVTSINKHKSSNGSILESFGLSTGPSTTSTESGGDRFYTPDPIIDSQTYVINGITSEAPTDIALDWKSDFSSSLKKENVSSETTVISHDKPARENLPDIDFSKDFVSKASTAPPINEKPVKEKLPDVSFDKDFFKSSAASNKYNDIKPSDDVNSKTYDASEFMDLYPQPKNLTRNPLTEDTVVVKQKEVKSKLKKKLQKPTEKAPPAPETTSVKLRSKGHRKKSSSGSTQVNPRSSLTLDGAIYNLEIAVEINRQQGASPVTNPKVFGDEDNEEDLLRKIEKDTTLDNWLVNSPGQDSPLLSSRPDQTETDDGQKTGFDFLDNW